MVFWVKGSSGFSIKAKKKKKLIITMRHLQWKWMGTVCKLYNPQCLNSTAIKEYAHDFNVKLSSRNTEIALYIFFNPFFVAINILPPMPSIDLSLI